MSELISNGPTKSMDALRSRPASELRAIGKLPAKAAGSDIRAFFEANKSSLSALVQGHVTPDRLLGVALNAIRQTPKLQECTVASLFGAIVQCAVMALEPNTHEGHCYLIPRKKSRPVKDENGNIVKDRSGRWIMEDIHEVNVQLGYKGRIELAYRSPKLKSLRTAIIHANDTYEIIEGSSDPQIVHKPNTKGDRGPAIIYYAVAELATGGKPLFEWMAVSDIERIRDLYSEGYQRADQNRQEALRIIQDSNDAKEQKRARYDLDKAEDNPWIRDFDAMARKTVLNKLDPYLPSTPEAALAKALDLRDAALRSQDLGGVIDGNSLSYDGGEEDEMEQRAIEHSVTITDTTMGKEKEPVSAKRQPKKVRLDEAPPPGHPASDNDTMSDTSGLDPRGKDAEDLIMQFNAVKQRHEYDALVNNPAIRSQRQRIVKDRPDLIDGVAMADRAASDRTKPKEPPPSDDGPPWEELGAPPE